MNAKMVVAVVVLFASGCGSDDDTTTTLACIPYPGLERTKPDGDYIIGDPESNGLAIGTVSDPNTGLTWSRCSLGQSLASSVAPGGGPCGNPYSISDYTWSEALAAVRSANEEGYQEFTDWRLPNVKELSTLVDTSCANVTMNTNVFRGVTRGAYWSSSPNVDSRLEAWGVDFSNGNTMSLTKTDQFAVRLVRGGD